MTIGAQFATRNEVEQLRRKLTLAISGKNLISVNEYDLIAPPIAFLNLTDVPVSYAAAGNWVVRVKSTVDALEFADLKGTTNQVTVTENAADFTLSLPQDIHTGASPTFVTAKLSALTDGYVPYHVSDGAGLADSPMYTDGISIVTIRNDTDAAVDPIIQFAVGATPVTKYTMGVDDSDGDKFKISAGSVLGTTDRLVFTADPRIGFFTASPLAPLHFITPSPGSLPDIIFEETLATKGLTVRLKNPVRSWDLLSDSSPDRFGIGDVEANYFPFFIEGGVANIGLFFKQTTAGWEADGGTGTKFGTGAKNIIGWNYGSDASTFPATVPASMIQFGSFQQGLGIKDCTRQITSYYGGPRTYINETTNSDMTIGLTINAGSNLDQVIAFKSSLVAHGMTDLAETDTFADFRINSAPGGLEINAYVESVAVPLGLYAWYPTGNVGLDSTAWGAVTIYAGKKDGTGYGDVGATDNIFALRPMLGSAFTSCFAVDATGNSWQNGAITAPTLNLSGTSNQIVLQSAGVTGTITATPASSNKVWTLQDVTGTIYQTAGTDVAVADGGTGLSSYAVGDLLYASAGTTLAGLADVAVGSYLASGGVTTAPAWATLNQAAVAGLTTASSPEFVTVKLSGLTDGYIPYHVADATGLANSPIYTDGTKLGIRTAAPSKNIDARGGSDDFHFRIFSEAANKYVVIDLGRTITPGSPDTFNWDMSFGVAGATDQLSSDAEAGDCVLKSSAGKLFFQNGDAASAMVISANQVGIGTPTPSGALLHIKGNSTAGWIKLETTSGNPTIETVSGSFNVKVDGVDNQLYAATNRVQMSAGALYVYNSGLIGVNDPSPAEALDVTGNINCTGVYKVDDVQVVSNRVIDARCDDAINSGDATTDGVIDALRDAMIAHGLIAAA